MSSDDGLVMTAVRLMRLALPLLDRAGDGHAAACLQHAIDTAEGCPARAPTPEELSRFLEDDGRDANLAGASDRLASPT